MPRNEKPKEGTAIEQPNQNQQVVEVTINLELINNKLNYLITAVEQIKANLK